VRGARLAQARRQLEDHGLPAARFRATCYQAANWVYVGKTQGRGKLGDHRLGQVPVKTVWLYPLVADCRARLCR